VVDGQVGTGLQDALDALVPRWIADIWSFRQPRYIGRDLSWADWLALPDIDPLAASPPATWRHRHDPARSPLPLCRRHT
jgi:hypothetical protein